VTQPLDPLELFHACDAGRLEFETTAELGHLTHTIGQERALDSIQFGVGIPHEGYNLYVMGSTGLGRHTMVKEALEQRAKDAPRPPDWCYISNYEHPHNPLSLSLPAGTARRLRKDMEQLVDDLLSAIPAAFQSDEYRRRAKEITDEFKSREEHTAVDLGQKAQQQGIALLHGPTGYTLAPQKKGKILYPEEFEELSEDEQESLSELLEQIKEELKKAMGKLPEWQREMQRRFKRLDTEIVELTVAHFIEELEKAYSEFPRVLEYLTNTRKDIVENMALFRQEEADGKPHSGDEPEFNRYRINILVDNADSQGAPIVFEDNPTYQNLIGRVEHLARMGTLVTDFTLIKQGAFHRANGGYLILDVEKVLTSPFAWTALKRVLRSQEVRIESLERQLSLVSTISLEPQPVPIDLKVVLIGSRLLFYLLKEYEPEFGLLFKVTADFSEDMPREGDNEVLYSKLIASLQHREGLREISRDGVARIIEESARRAWNGEKLSLHMGGLLDLLQEADYWAGQANSGLVRKQDVQDAIDAQTRRVDQLREQLQERVLENTIKIDTDGVQLSQVNGLSVIQLGDYAFGIPTRISATARLGSGDVVDIEREIEQGGPIHSKGVMILSSYLGERYAKHQPLSLSASLVFEQSYGLVEGDSASAAELCSLLSSIGDIPLRQSLAITGSINQHGEIQAIGGVSQKVEGFFDICQNRRLTGEQGVIIPHSNIKDLMLKQEVVDAARAGKFAVYAVRHVDQAMELLTGLPAGIPDADGIYPEGSINSRIQIRLAEWITLRQHYAGQQQKEP
jgi:lon-related putative ATP-dependent protease